MSEKRFIFHGIVIGIEDTLEPIKEDKYTPCNKDGFQDLVELLNELHEENIALKDTVEALQEQLVHMEDLE